MTTSNRRDGRIAGFAYDKKARDIIGIDLAGISPVTDYFVICTGNSSTQVKSLGGEVEFKMEEREVAPAHFEGRDNNGWIVLDYGTVIVHIFNRENRDFYKLEKLYGDAEEVHFLGIDDKIGEEQ